MDWILIAILGAAFLARAGVLLALHDHPLLQARPGLDGAVYLELAQRVAGGDLLLGDRVFFLSPFYIYFLAAGLALSGGSTVAVQVAQVLLGTAAVWFVAKTAGFWFGERGAHVAGALAAATGYFAFQESRILQSALDPVLTAAGLWALARAWMQPRAVRFLLAGALLGLHVLNRPNLAIWAVAAVALTAVLEFGRGRGRAEERTGTRRPVFTAALVVGLVVAVAPVALRNYAVAGDLTLVSSHGGLNFFIGNNSRADGTYRPVEGITPSIEGQAEDMRAVAARATGRRQTDTEASSWFFRQARDWIGTNPGAAALLFVKKIAFVFNAADIPLNDSYAYYASEEVSPLRVMLVGPWVLLPLGLAGLWFARPRHRRPAEAGGAETPVRAGVDPGAWWRWTAFVPVYALGVATFFVTGRYRLPLLVALCVTAAGSVLLLVDRAKTGQWRRAGTALGSIALLAVLTNVNLGLDNGVAAWRTEMVVHQIESGRDAEAEALLARAEPDHPNPALLLYRAGRTWLARGDAARALPVLERARAAAPERRDIDLEIGKALLAAGQAPRAVERLQASRGVAGREHEAAVALAQAHAMAGQPEEALRELASLGAPETLAPDLQVVAGRLALELRRPDVAEPFLARAVRAAPDRPEVAEAYGLALASLGKRPEAIAALEDVTRLDPANAGVRMNLAILYADAGRFAEARRIATEVQRLQPGEPRVREFLDSLPPDGDARGQTK